MIDIRNHCIPAYDELSRFNKVCPIPAELQSMEQETAGGIIQKLKAVIESQYFTDLSETAIIKSGAVLDYQWSKSKAKDECQRIINECQPFIQ